MDKEKFNKIFSGSAVKRIGYEKWISNIAIAIGNANKSPILLKSLLKRVNDHSELIQDHVKWAISQQEL
jgi:epoxyqueuosine reductase